MKDDLQPLLGSDYTMAHARVKKLNQVQEETRARILADDKPGNYEIVGCICRQTDALVLSQVERHGLPYRKIICTDCGLLRVSPRWNQSIYNKFYEEHYRNLYNPLSGSRESYIQYLSKHPAMKGIAKWITAAQRRFGANTSSPSAVEIGSGGGWILHNLPRSWQRTGFDVDKDFLEIGQRLFGVNMVFGFLDEALQSIPQADVIILSHVVEHFLDPVTSLSSIVNQMSDEALLMIEVPGVLRIHKTNLDPMTYMQNAHAFTFCAFTLKYVCELAGLDVLEIDEHSRAVCRRRNDKALPSTHSKNPELPKLIIEYLQKCDRFFKRYRSISAPALKPLALVYRRAFRIVMDKYISSRRNILMPK